MKTTKLLTAIAAATIALGLFSGCSTTEPEETTTEATTTQATTTEATTEEETTAALTESLIGQVYAVYTDSVYIEICESEVEIEDYSAVETGSLTHTASYKEIMLSDISGYYTASSGELTEISADVIVSGDYVAVSVGDDGEISVILFAYEEKTAYTVGKVTAFDGSSLAITLYEATEGYEISDATGADMTAFTATETEASYILDGTESVYLISEGIVNTVTSTAILESDMLVLYTDENGLPVIVIYPAE